MYERTERLWYGRWTPKMFERIISPQQDAELLGGALDDIQFLADTAHLAPQHRAALERLRLRIVQLAERDYAREREASCR